MPIHESKLLTLEQRTEVTSWIIKSCTLLLQITPFYNPIQNFIKALNICFGARGEDIIILM